MENKIKEGITLPSLTFYEPDEPVCFVITKSGWSRPQLYHVLIEHGDIMRTDYHCLEAEQIKEKFGIDVLGAYLNKPIVIRKKDSMICPNDGDFGKLIRKSFN